MEVHPCNESDVKYERCNLWSVPSLDLHTLQLTVLPTQFQHRGTRWTVATNLIVVALAFSYAGGFRVTTACVTSVVTATITVTGRKIWTKRKSIETCIKARLHRASAFELTLAATLVFNSWLHVVYTMWMFTPSICVDKNSLQNGYNTQSPFIARKFSSVNANENARCKQSLKYTRTRSHDQLHGHDSNSGKWSRSRARP